MATAVAVPPPFILGPGNGFSSDLSTASLDPPTVQALHVVEMNGGVFSVLADPRPAAQQKIGGIAPVHGLAVLGRVHVIPRRYDLGAVVSEQEAEVEVWNADLKHAWTLEQITVEGPAGIEVIDHLGQPFDFVASDSQVYYIKTLADGDPLIDNLVTWVFAGVDPQGTNIRLLGFRLIPFPFPPNWAQPVTEAFGFMTDILASYRGMEQRIQLRAIPVGTIRYSTLLDDLRDAQMANAILFGNQALVFGVGRWQFQNQLQQNANAGDHEVICDTADVPFEPGSLVLLWADPYRWEVQTVDSVLSDRLILNFGLQGDWTAGETAVLPLVVGRLSSDEAFTWQSLTVGSTALTFDIDGFRP